MRRDYTAMQYTVYKYSSVGILDCGGLDGLGSSSEVLAFFLNIITPRPSSKRVAGLGVGVAVSWIDWLKVLLRFTKLSIVQLFS